MFLQDDVIFDRLSQTSNDKDMLDIFSSHIDEYASMGYRTLCFAYSNVDPISFNKWKKLYKDASVSIYDRELNLSKAAEEIENNLHLIGVSAIEDKLQDVYFYCYKF